jgi:glycosyltransferase involved in cell wall biosynthesis
MLRPSLAIIIAYAGEQEYLDETMPSVFSCDGVSEVVIGVDLSRTTKVEADLAWRKWQEHGDDKNIPIKLVYSKIKGPSAVRNLAISESTSTYILPVDSDDRINSMYPANIIDILNENQNAGIVYGGAELFGESHGKWNLEQFSPERIVLENCIYATAGYRKQDWETVGGYDEDLIYGQEDWDFWLKILSLGREVKYIEETMFYYRIRSNSRSASFRGMWEQVIWTYDRVCQNNSLYMANQVNAIYHRRIQLELENSNLATASRSLMVAIVKRFPYLRRFINTKLARSISSKLRK